MNRRSEKLDQYLNKQVEIIFIDGDVESGILDWNEHLEPYMLLPQHYYLTKQDGLHLCFRKSHVKSIKKARDKMTYEEIYEEFCNKFPNAEIEDYRPADPMFIPQLLRGIPNAIIVWFKDKSKVVYIAESEG